MKKKKIIAIICVAAATISVIAGGCYLWQKNKTNNEKVDCYSDEQLEEIDKVKSNMKVSEEVISVQFDTYEELETYMDNYFEIRDVDEAREFIEEFLNACETNVLEVMLAYYSEDMWENVIANKAVPAFDESGLCSFEYNNINVEETDIDNQYKVTYVLSIMDSVTGAVEVQAEREDYFTLNKSTGSISIIEYERNTISTK